MPRTPSLHGALMRKQPIFWFAVAVLLTAPSSLLAQKPAAGPAIRPFDTRYITDDFVLAGVAHSRRMLERRTSKQAMKELEKIIGKKAIADGFAEVKEDFGVPSEQFVQTLILVDREFLRRASAPTVNGPPMPMPSIIFRFHSRVDQRAAMKPYVGDPQARQKEKEPPPPRPEKMKHAGKNYYRKRHVVQQEGKDVVAGYLAACFVDDKTLIVAEEQLFKRMLNAQCVDSPLTRELIRIGSEPDIMLVVTKEPLTAWAGSIPRSVSLFDLSKLVDLVAKIDTLAITVEFDGQSSIAIATRFAAEKSATAYASMMSKEVLSPIKLLWGLQRPALDAKATNDEKTMYAAINELIESIRVKRSGKEVVVSLPRPNRLGEFPKLFAPAIRAAKKSRDAATQKTN